MLGYYYENWDPSQPRNITSQSRKPKKMSRMLRSTDDRPRRGKLLPEHIDLGLRLTVGEDVIQKPFLESKHGDGKFPEMQPHTEAAPNPYYPSLPGSPGDAYSNFCIKYKVYFLKSFHNLLMENSNIFQRRILL